MLGKAKSILSLKSLTDDSISIKLEVPEISSDRAEAECNKMIDKTAGT
jgi:hypothetical protein